MSIEDLKYSISFDVVIDTNIATYRGNVSLDLPVGDILTEGTSQLDEKDCSNIVFKRETMWKISLNILDIIFKIIYNA